MTGPVGGFLNGVNGPGVRAAQFIGYSKFRVGFAYG
jgi:hypothetical protein